MTIEERAVGDVTILDLKGRITIEDEPLLRDTVNALLLQSRRHLLVNLADVPHVDSAGLGTLVGTYTTVANRDGHLKLLHLTNKLSDLMAITKLDTVFETFESEEAAVRSFD